MTTLRTDRYTLTMADSFVRHGRDDVVSFEVTFRRLPPERTWIMVCGVLEAVQALEGLHTDADELAWLRQDGAFSPELLARLAGLRFTGTVWAVPDGTCLPGGLPVLRVTAPRVEATIVEPVVLAALNYGTRVASVAADVVTAAAGRPVYDFSLRRLDGPEAGLATARAAWVAGVAATALPEAGLRYGLPTVGTMAHHAILAHGEDREEATFAEWLVAHPAGTSLLVDGYDTPRGVQRAIAAARTTGVPLHGIRIDSGDLGAEAHGARSALDAAGHHRTEILLSGDLDAPRIAALVAAGVPVDAFGIGTRLRSGEPLGAVYKLCAQPDAADPELRAVMKRTPGKETDPGVHQVTRPSPGGDGVHLLHLNHEAHAGEGLLRPVLVGGQRVSGALDSVATRAHAATELATALRSPPGTVRRSPALLALRDRASRTVR